MMYRLRFRSPYGTTHYFTNFGQQWPNRPECRLIERTSTDPEEARQFPSEEEANAALVTAGRPSSWTVEEVS